MSDSESRPAITPVLWYQDPSAALAWLEKAFGFETRMLVVDGEGGVLHSESAFGDGMVMVVGPPRDHAVSPNAWGGRHTASTHVHMDNGIDDHYARARAAGAVITREIATQAYGDRVYICADPEGHQWSFAQTVKTMTADEMAEATGREISTPHKET